VVGALDADDSANLPGSKLLEPAAGYGSNACAVLEQQPGT
jgi:hypothetical protein